MKALVATHARFGRSAVLLLALCSFSCQQHAQTAPPPPVVEVLHPVRREVLEWDDYTARLEAVETVEIRPRVSGYLQSVLFQDGAMVNEGDLLFVIDPRPYEAALRRTEADLAAAKARAELARRNHARSGELLRTHAISQEEADIREANVAQSQAAVRQAESNVDAARLDVEFTHLVAPIRGRIGRRLVTEGNLVNGGSGSQGTLLTTIVSLDPIYAYFEADERAYLKYMHLAASGERPSSRDVANPVWIGLADETGFPRKGAMNFVDNQFDASTGTMTGRAVVPNPDGLLAPGLFARLRLAGSGRYEAIVVPDEAVANDQARKFVWVVDAQQVAQPRPVTPGPLLDGARVIREGLTTEDLVIVSGMQRVRPGLVVDPRRVDDSRWKGELPPDASPPGTSPKPGDGRAGTNGEPRPREGQPRDPGDTAVRAR